MVAPRVLAPVRTIRIGETMVGYATLAWWIGFQKTGSDGYIFCGGVFDVGNGVAGKKGV